MNCSACDSAMIPGYSYDLPDDSETLSFRSWRCRTCGNSVEEIHTNPHQPMGKPRLIRYAVRTAAA
jgi:hypothetical protein